MKPTRQNNQQGQLFEPRFSKILDKKHPLIQLAEVIDWSNIEEDCSNLFIEGVGQPAKPVRLVVGLMMLQNMYGMSDKSIVHRWVENPYWQYFCGYDFLEHDFPIHPTSLTRWRHRLSEEGLSQVLQTTITAAVEVGAVKKKALSKLLLIQR